MAGGKPIPGLAINCPICQTAQAMQKYVNEDHDEIWICDECPAVLFTYWRPEQIRRVSGVLTDDARGESWSGVEASAPTLALIRRHYNTKRGVVTERLSVQELAAENTHNPVFINAVCQALLDQGTYNDSDPAEGTVCFYTVADEDRLILAEQYGAWPKEFYVPERRTPS